MKLISWVFNKQLVVLSAILLLAFFLRLYKYEYFPIGGETADESAWTYLGASLIQEQQPTSWSFFGPYYDGFIFLDRGVDHAPLVRPVLDHPPLFSFLPGAFHTLKNNWQDHPSVKLVRLPMIFLGTINVALLFFLTKKYFKKIGWVYLTTLIYATAPSFVFGSRLVVAENLLITWTLLALFLLAKEKIKWRLFWLILLSVLAIMTKTAGVVVPLSIICFGLSTGQKQITKSGLLGLIVGLVVFVLYGAAFNLQLFLAILSSQAGRNLGWLTLHNRFFIHPSVIEKVFFDGWVVLGLFATAVSFFRNQKKYLALNIFLVLNLFFILATSGEYTYHGWYDYVLYPLFALVIGSLLKNILKKKNYLLFALMWILLLPVFRISTYYGGWYKDFSPLVLRVVMGLGLLPLAFSFLPAKFSKHTPKIIWLCLGLILLANVLAIVLIKDTSYWEMNDVVLQQ